MPSNVVLSLKAKTRHVMLEQIILAEFSKIAILEIRADFLIASELTFEVMQMIRKATSKQIIFTLRKESEGGFCSFSDAERYEFYKSAMDLGYDYIDVEYSSKDLVQKLFEEKHSSKIILSYHNFRDTNPVEITNTYLDMCYQKPDVIKIATMANKETDNEILQELLNGHKINSTDLTCFCIGDLGKKSRISNMKNSNSLTFVATEKRRKTFPGQLTYEELLRIKDEPI